MYKDAISAGGYAVVTGAASGVGLVAALRYAEAGLGAILADLPGPQLDAAVAQVRASAATGVQVLGKPTDITDDAAVDELADMAFSTGPIALLMNNAGIGGLPTKPWSGMDNWQRMLDVNFFGALRCTHAFLPRMIEANRSAVVINTGSKQGITTPPGNPAYNVSKAALRILSEQLAYELRTSEAPISVHLFVPGFTYTGMVAAAFPDKPPAACPDNDVDEIRDRRRIEWSAQDILENRPALSRWHPDYKEAFATFENADRD
jgi:NAD(P)-dependent dehydrogenase (short-subunit alcohol dehydrogenase family)